jgi:cobalt-zinc-cadmium efflux system protein
VAYPTYFLLRDTVHILMEGNPSGITDSQVQGFIRARFAQIRLVKDLRIWAITPEKIMVAVRVRSEGAAFGRPEVRALKNALVERFGFHDVYVEAYEDEV